MSGTRAKATALVAGLQLILAAALPGQNRGVETLFPAQPVGYINDFAGILDPAAEAELDDLVRRLKTATGGEIAVVTLPSIGDREAAEVALAIGRKWKVGAQAEIGDPRRNAGIVLLVVPRQDHRPGTGHVRIEVGQGLEGVIPDALTPRIVRDVMGPDLAREAYGPAVLKGVQFMASTIARGYGVSDSTLTSYRPVQDTGGSGGTPVGSLLPILFFVVFMVLASRAQGARRRRRNVYWGGPWIGGGWGGGGGFGGGGGGFGGFGGGGGFSGGGGGGRF